MKTFEQLAQSAYEAYTKERTKALPGYAAEFPPLPWAEAAQTIEGDCWITAAKQLWAEFAAMH